MKRLFCLLAAALPADRLHLLCRIHGGFQYLFVCTGKHLSNRGNRRRDLYR